MIFEYSKAGIPTHSLMQAEYPVCLEDIGYNNPYDFTREHRHGYFELILLQQGGGMQYIDFSEIELNDYSCYIILPNQVHLLKRDTGASGTVIQFCETAIQSACLLSCLIQLREPAIFEISKDKFAAANSYIDLIRNIQVPGKPLTIQGCGYLLQAFLFHLLGLKDDASACREAEAPHGKFANLVDLFFCERHTVKEYLQELSISESKLASLVKKHFGVTPLQLIHNRMLLEAKRLLVFQNESYKEIAYALGFKTPSHFSQFIKNKTGLNPSSLQQNLLKSSSGK